MWDRVKGIGNAIWVALLALAAFYAASRVTAETRSKEKWKKTAEDMATADVAESLHETENALDMAAIHRTRAKVAREKTEKRLDAIARRDDAMADIVSGWTSGRVRDE